MRLIINKIAKKNRKMSDQISFQSAIKSRNLRMTDQRRLVLRVLEESDEHLDAEAIYDLVRKQNPRISLATVYRTLALFKELGLISEHKLGEDHSHFETAQNEPHYHFTCLACRKIIEFSAPEIDDILLPRIKKQGLEINEVHLILSGYCADCQANLIEGKKQCSPSRPIHNEN